MDTEKKQDLSKEQSLSEGAVAPHYETDPGSNIAVIHDAIENIGMGRYQWGLTLSCGFGFIADQVKME
jgi:hypothetical protein